MALNREGRKAIPIPDDIKNFIGDLVIKGHGYGYIINSVKIEYKIKYSITKLKANNVKTFNKKDVKIREKQLNKVELQKVKDDFFNEKGRKAVLAYVDLSDFSEKSKRIANKSANIFRIKKESIKIGCITNGEKSIIKTWIVKSTGEKAIYFKELIKLAFQYGLKYDIIVIDTNFSVKNKDNTPIFHKPIIRVKKTTKNPYNQVVEKFFSVKDQIYPYIKYLKTLTIYEAKLFIDNMFKVYLLNTEINPIMKIDEIENLEKEVLQIEV